MFIFCVVFKKRERNACFLQQKPYARRRARERGQEGLKGPVAVCNFIAFERER